MGPHSEGHMTGSLLQKRDELIRKSVLRSSVCDDLRPHADVESHGVGLGALSYLVPLDEHRTHLRVRTGELESQPLTDLQRIGVRDEVIDGMVVLSPVELSTEVCDVEDEKPLGIL